MSSGVGANLGGHPYAANSSDLVSQGMKYAAAGARYLLGHVALNRANTMLALENELKKDNRIPQDKGLDGLAGVAKQIYSNGGVSDMLRGVLPQGAITAATMYLNKAINDGSLGKYIQPMTGKNTSVSSMLGQLLTVPLGVGMATWPMMALNNIIQSNYTADIKGSSPSNADAAADGQKDQTGSYTYNSAIDAIKSTVDRVGLKNTFLQTGIGANVMKQYVMYGIAALPGIIARMRNNNAAVSSGAQAAQTPMGNILRMIAYSALVYPLNNIMLRMSMLKGSGGDAQGKGGLRYESVMDCIRQVMNSESWKGLYAGFAYNIAAQGLMQGLQGGLKNMDVGKLLGSFVTAK